MKPLVIWGATGQAKVLNEFIGALGYELVALFDNNPSVSSPFNGVPLFRGEPGFLSWRDSWRGPEVSGLVAIGSPGRVRVQLQAFMAGHGVASIQAFHPTAFVARDAVVGKGCQVLAQSAVATEVQLGDQCIINTSASVDHESVLGAGVHVAPGATLAGCVKIGDGTFIGAGSVILPRLKVGANCLVGAGSVVTKDIPDNVVVLGVPARIARPNPS